MDVSRQAVSDFWSQIDPRARLIVESMDSADTWAVDRSERIEPLLIELMHDATEEDIQRAKPELMYRLHGYIHSSRALRMLAGFTEADPKRFEQWVSAAKGALEDPQTSEHSLRLANVMLVRLQALERHFILQSAFSPEAVARATRHIRPFREAESSS